MVPGIVSMVHRPLLYMPITTTCTGTTTFPPLGGCETLLTPLSWLLSFEEDSAVITNSRSAVLLLHSQEGSISQPPMQLQPRGWVLANRI